MVPSRVSCCHPACEVYESMKDAFGSAEIRRRVPAAAGRGNVLGMVFLFVATAFISPLLTVFLSLLVFTGTPTEKMAVACAFGIGFSAALVAHGIVYNHPVDMTRWMVECRYYDGRSLLSIGTSLNEDHNGLLVWNLLCWITGNIGDLRLLQSLAAFFGYGLIAWLMMDKCADESTDAWAFLPLMLFIFLAIPTQPLIGNVRSALGCVICAVAICKRGSYEFKESLPSLILIIVACLIHSSMLLVLVLFLVQPVLERNPVRNSIICAAAVAAVISVASLLLESHVFDGVPIIAGVLEKASFYTTGTEWDQEQAGNLLSNLSHVLSLLLLGLLVLRIYATKQHDERIAFGLVLTSCVIAMELTLVNVGNRLKYIPILLESTYLLNNRGRGIAINSRWPILADFVLILLAIVIWLISMSSFIPSFNYVEVMKTAVFYPLSFL